MTPNEAYSIINTHRPLMRLRSCLDFGDFFAFCLSPLDISMNDDYIAGTIVDAVDKKTGKIFKYNIVDNPGLFYSAKEIKIKTFFDMKVAEVMR